MKASHKAGDRDGIIIPRTRFASRRMKRRDRWQEPFLPRPVVCWRTLSVAPIVERVELSRNRRTALLRCLFEVSDGPHDVRVAHVARRIIILVHGEDAR